MGRVSMPQGKGSQLHNRREHEKIGKPIPDNIDSSKTAENITLVDRDIRQVYHEIFGDALEQYNSKQKRADRKIEDYYDHIQKSKNGEKLFYEDVVQWGGKHDFQNPQTRERAQEALVKYVEGFEERNPNLRLVGAYIHMDEASPHLHLDYVPVAHGYSRGLSTRNSLDRAMKEMGFAPENESRKNNATKLWKEHERAVFGEICRSLGLEVEPERKSERKSLTVDEYKEARDQMLDAVNSEIEPIRKDLANRQQALEQKIERSTEQTKMPKATLGHVKAADAQKLVEENRLLREELTVSNEQNILLQRQIKLLQADKDIMKKKVLEQQHEVLKQEYHRFKSVVEKFVRSIGAVRQFQEFSSLFPDKKMNIKESMQHAERIRTYNLKYKSDVHLKDLAIYKKDEPVR